MAEQDHLTFGTVIFGYDHQKELAFIGLLHMEEGSPPHMDSSVYLPWVQVPLLLEKMATLFEEMNPVIEVYERLVKDGMTQEEAKRQAWLRAQRQRDIGEP